MQYQYDWNDDLVAFIDRERHTNTFTYDDFGHYLLELTDARGVTPMTQEYDDSGRLIRHIDAFGYTIEYERIPIELPFDRSVLDVRAERPLANEINSDRTRTLLSA